MTKYSFVLASILFLFLFSISFGQTGKRDSDPRGDILDHLHPKPTGRDAPRGMKLLPGYKNKSSTDFEGNDSGEISKKGGLKIKYEMGFNEGLAIKSEDKGKYLSYSEQIVNGHIVRSAFTKDHTYIVSVQLGDAQDTWSGANFYTTVKRVEDGSDMLMMALTLVQK